MKKCKLLICLLFFLSFSVFANDLKRNPVNKLIENMTWKEVEALVEDTKVVIIPLGAQSKEHGPHLPMNNDYIMANFLRDRLLEKVEHILAVPTVGYNYYPAFTQYPGSISLDMAASEGIILGICRSLAKQGFKKFYVLNVGFSTNQILEKAKFTLKNEGIFMDYLVLSDVLNQPEVTRLIQQVRGSHADEVETSMMLYMTPEIVHMEKAQKDDNVEMTPGPLARDANSKVGTYSPTGAWGDATLATRKKGEIITHIVVDHIVKEVEKL